MKSPGQLAYEEDIRRKPLYHDGTPRKPWDRLGDVRALVMDQEPDT